MKKRIICAVCRLGSKELHDDPFYNPNHGFRAAACCDVCGLPFWSHHGRADCLCRQQHHTMVVRGKQQHACTFVLERTQIGTSTFIRTCGACEADHKTLYYQSDDHKHTTRRIAAISGAKGAQQS